MKNLLCITFLLFFTTALYAQCECTDCPIPIVDNSTFTSFMDIDGAVNNDLESPNQQLCMICLNLTQDAMEELDIILTAPDGSNVALTVNDVIGFGQDIFFEICFVTCDQAANPDPGFDAVFDTSNDWIDGTTYTGTYYPQDGCLEDLTGPVNGQWELEVSDVFFLEDGELFDWYLVFGDGTGIDCANEGACDFVPTCIAEGGELDVNNQTICEGDADLIFDVTPSWPGGNEPPGSEYGYTYIITNVNGGFIEEITPDQDFSSYAPGVYEICGLSFLLDDEGLIPDADGSLSIDDIQDDIDDEVYCADISDSCVEITINANLPDPILTGPLMVCSGQLVEYEVENYDPSFNYVFSLVGSFLTFNVDGGTVEVTWGDLPTGELCVYIEEDCFPSTVVCVDVEILAGIDDFEIIGNVNPCPGSTEVYDFLPIPGVGESYDVTVTGGTIINQTDTSVEIEWPSTEGTEELCIELITPSCDIDPFCVDIEVETLSLLPSTLDTPVQLCFGSGDISFLPFDDDVINYIWTVNNLNITSGQGTNLLEYEGVALGIAEVCLELETICGVEGPLCEEIEVIENPDPTITPIDPTCSLMFDLESTADASNDLSWTLLSGPGAVGFDPDDEPITTATFSDPGIYIINLSEINGICHQDVEIEVEILDSDPLEIIGNLNPCPGSIENYNFLPIPGTDESYDVTVTGGTIINQTDDSVEIEWPSTDGTEELCIDLINPSCDTDPFCVDIEIESLSLLPSTLDTPPELCLESIGSSFVPFDVDIINYTWTLTNLNLISGQGTEMIEYEGLSVGVAEVCLEIETECGIEGPLCEDLEILQNPDPEITPVDPSCNFMIDLESTADLSNEINWTLISGPGSVDFDPSDEPNTTATFGDPGTYIVLLTETNGICQETEEIEVVIIDDLEIVDLTFDCNVNNEYTVSFEIITGDEPYEVNGDPIFGSFFESEVINSGDSYSFEVIDDLGCSVTVEGIFECPCLSDAGSMPQDVIESCIQDNATITVIWNGDGVLDNNDVGTFILHDGSTDEIGEIFDINEFGEFTYINDLTIGETYYISYVVGNELASTVDLDDLCLSVSFGQPIIFYDISQLDFQVETETCESSIFIDGFIPIEVSDIIWSQIDGPGNSTFDSNTSLPTSITVTEQGTYLYEVEVVNQACISYQEFEVNFLLPPVIINPVEECDAGSDFYTISVQVDGGEAPYQANLPGTFVGNIFTSELIASGDAYSLIITDNLGCSSLAFDGSKLCDCNSDAGVLNGQPITLCEGDPLVFDEINNEVLDVDDFGQYYLYTFSPLDDIVLIDSSLTPMFPYPNTINLDETYFVSFIVGNGINNGIDFFDPCLDISNSLTVTWNSFPVVDAGPDEETCIEDYVLNASPPNGQWDVVASATGMLPFISNFTDPNATIELQFPGEYILEWVSFNGQCESRDEVIIVRNIVPEVLNLTTSCNDDLETYLVSFDLINGGPFIVNGEMVVDSYSLDLIDNSIETTFDVENAVGCITEIKVGPINCECQNDAGTIDNTPFTLCTDELLNPNITNADYVLEPGDSLTYIIHNGTADVIGDILKTSLGDDIIFDDNFETNTTYYLTLLVGETLAGVVDINDPCLQTSESVPVEWLEDTNIVFEGMLDACIGDIVEATIQVSGNLPVDIRISNIQSDEEVITIQNETEIIAFEVMEDFQEWTIINAEGLCIDEIFSDLVIIGQAEAMFNLSQDLEVCNGTSFVSELDLSTIIDIDDNVGEWISAEIPIIDGVADFSNLDPGAYSVEFSTIGMEGLCPGTSQSTTITVIECLCPIFVNPDLILCNDEELFELNNLDVQGFEGDWTIENSAGLTPVPLIDNGQLNIANAAGGDYTLVYTITQSDYPEECDNLVTINLSIEEERKTGIQIDEAIFCQDQIVNINLFDLIEDEDLGGIWTIDEQEVSELQDITNLNLGINEFIYAFENNNAICLDNMTSVLIDIKPVPIFQAFGEDVICFGDDNGEISIVVEDQGSGLPVSWFVDDILQGDDKVLTDLAPGVYTVYVENEFCRSLVQEIVIDEPQAVAVNLGDDRQIMLDEVITIQALINILESDVDSITWTDLSEILQVDEYELMSSFDSDASIGVEVIDVNGCVAFDQILIRVLEAEISIYIPNIFNTGSQIGNETFGIINSDVVEVLNTFNIYDRWGNLVFSEGVLAAGQELPRWDGRFNGELAEQGVYVYFIEATLINGEKEILAGDITLLH